MVILPAGLFDCAKRAGTLLFMRLVFSDEMKGSSGPLFVLGALGLLGQAALATHTQRQQAAKQLEQRTSAVPLRLRKAACNMALGEYQIEVLAQLFHSSMNLWCTISHQGC